MTNLRRSLSNRPFATMEHVTSPSLNLILGTLQILETERAGKNK